ncbi:MAG: hypothetical protein ACK55I_03750 [bacterium]
MATRPQLGELTDGCSPLVMRRAANELLPNSTTSFGLYSKSGLYCPL